MSCLPESHILSSCNTFSSTMLLHSYKHKTVGCELQYIKSQMLHLSWYAHLHHSLEPPSPAAVTLHKNSRPNKANQGKDLIWCCVIEIAPNMYQAGEKLPSKLGGRVESRQSGVGPPFPSPKPVALARRSAERAAPPFHPRPLWHSDRDELRWPSCGYCSLCDVLQDITGHCK